MSCDECYYFFVDLFKLFFKDFEQYKYYYNYHYNPILGRRDSPTNEWINLENIDASTQTNYDDNDNELIEKQPHIESIFNIDDISKNKSVTSGSNYDDWISIDTLFSMNVNNGNINKKE